MCCKFNVKRCVPCYSTNVVSFNVCFQFHIAIMSTNLITINIVAFVVPRSMVKAVIHIVILLLFNGCLICSILTITFLSPNQQDCPLGRIILLNEQSKRVQFTPGARQEQHVDITILFTLTSDYNNHKVYHTSQYVKHLRNHCEVYAIWERKSKNILKEVSFHSELTYTLTFYLCG